MSRITVTITSKSPGIYMDSHLCTSAAKQPLKDWCNAQPTKAHSQLKFYLIIVWYLKFRKNQKQEQKTKQQTTVFVRELEPKNIYVMKTKGKHSNHK